MGKTFRVVYQEIALWAKTFEIEAHNFYRLDGWIFFQN
jgi:hypothetical protein